MATTYTVTAQQRTQDTATVTASGDASGGVTYPISDTQQWNASGGDAPTLSGILSGQFTAAAGDLLLAHATDPLQGMGDASYSPGFTVAGSKLKRIRIKNTDGTNMVTVKRGAANGLPILDTAGAGVPIGPGDTFDLTIKAGMAALSTGSNDKLTVSVSGGSPVCDIEVWYGP